MKGYNNGLEGNPMFVSTVIKGGCQEIRVVAIMFFFELLFSYMLLSISFYVFPSPFLFSLILNSYLTLKANTSKEVVYLVTENSLKLFYDLRSL